MSDSDYVESRRQELYDFLRDHPHVKYTYTGLAYALEREVDTSLTTDMSAVRHWAQDRGACITNCSYDPEEQKNVFQYLPAGEEQMQSVRPLRKQSRDTRTRLRNLGKQAAYTRKNAVRKEDRSYGKLNEQISTAVSQILTAVEEHRVEMNGTH
jgi:hypothetical protein